MDDTRTDTEFLRDALKALSPLWVLNRVSTRLAQLTGATRGSKLFSTLFLASARGCAATDDELAAMRAQASRRSRLLSSNPATRAALERLIAAGVNPEWGEEGEYGYSAAVMRLVVPLEALPQLHEQAAADAGITGESERAQASGDYQLWQLQTYAPDGEVHRGKSPRVETNPYDTERNDFGRNPNPDLSAQLG